MKLTAVVLLTALSALLGWYLVKPSPPTSARRIGANAAELQDFLEENRELWKASAGAPPAAPGEAGGLQRGFLSEREARTLFAMPRKEYAFDPALYYRYLPDMELKVPWPEHPDGFYVKATNANGLREERDEPATRLDLFVLVTGDSHTDGVCDNDESFANQLEARLRERHPQKSIEVWNAGITGYSFYNYLGALEKYLDRKPLAFVVAIYGGNDFIEVLKVHHYFQRTVPPERPKGYWEKISAASEVCSYAVAIALNQALYFQSHPEQVDVALDAARRVCAEIQRLCLASGTHPIFVYIPPGFDLTDELDPQLLAAKELLGLSDYDFHHYDRLADALLGELERQRADVIDLRRHFRDDVRSFYWSDLHINLKAHQLLAELLLPRVEALWQPR